MRIGPDEKLWVVVDPKPTSTEADMCFRASLRDLELQFRGGLTMAENPTLFTDEREAKMEAYGRLTAMRVAQHIVRCAAEGRPLEGATRVEIIGPDGQVVFAADIG